MLCLGNLHVTDYSNASATGMYDPYIVSSTCGIMETVKLQNYPMEMTKITF